MTPLTMTAEEEEWLRSRCDCATSLRGDDYPWQRLLRQARAEIDALRRLPVIATCGDCTHPGFRMERTVDDQEVCTHADAPRPGNELFADDASGPPPAWCPLRGTP